MSDLSLACLYCAAAMDEDASGDYCATECQSVHLAEQATRRAGRTREARCGHLVPVHPGRQRRACDICAGQPRAVAGGKLCLMCATALPPLRSGRGPQRLVYCSKACDKRAASARVSAARLAARPPIECPVCSKSFERSRRDQRFCSVFCSDVNRGQRRAVPLPLTVCALDDCDVEFQPMFLRQRCCSEAHGKKLWNRKNPEPWNDRKRDHYHRRRALKAGASTGRPVVLAEIRMRDGNRCHLCDKTVPDKAWPHPQSPSLDHVVPLSKGGAHDPDNVKLAHLECNTAKGNRGGNEQLLLIG